jgi:Mn2+/Fe2+ NRAMP family transporter
MLNFKLPTRRSFFARYWKQILVILSVFGPATITAMADNDASGVATYAVAGAKLGYPILFLLLIVTVLLGITQEMGVRLSIVSRKGLADLIRERFGVRASILIFAALFIANLGILVVDAAAVEVTAEIFKIPSVPAVILVIAVAYIVVVKGSYKFTQYFMLITCLFFLVYVISAVKANPDWGLAFSNLLYPHGVKLTSQYLRDYLIIGMGVLGTTVTSWGQFFISSFSVDKKIEKGKINYSQLAACRRDKQNDKVYNGTKAK